MKRTKGLRRSGYVPLASLWQANDENVALPKGGSTAISCMIPSSIAPTVRRMIAYGKRTPEGRSAAIGKRKKKEEALKGLRKGRISCAAVARGHPHTHNLAREFARAMGGELNDNGIRLGVDFFTTLLQSVMFCLAAVPMASLGEAPRLAIGYHTTHPWCVRTAIAFHRPENTMCVVCLHQRVKAGMKAPQDTIVYSPATAARYA